MTKTGKGGLAASPGMTSSLDFTQRLAPDTKIQIAKILINDAKTQVKNNGIENTIPFSSEQAARASARAMANLARVNRTFRNIVTTAFKDDPDAEMDVTRKEITASAAFDNNQFTKKIDEILKEHVHIGVNFSSFSSEKCQIILRKLAERRLNKLQHLTLDGFYPDKNTTFEQLTSSINKISNQNSNLNIGLSLRKNENIFITSSDTDAILGLLSNSKCHLTSLDLTGIEIELNDLQKIINNIAKSQVTHLNLNKINYGKERKLPKVEENQEKSREFVQAIQAMLSDASCKLTDLNLGSCIISDKDMSIIAKAVPHSNLTHIDLSDNEFGDSGAFSLAKALKQHSNLIQMNLCNNTIGRGMSLRMLMSMAVEPNCKLAVINLSHNNIQFDDVSIIDMSKFINFTSKNLTFDISSNPVSTINENRKKCKDFLLEKNIPSLQIDNDSKNNKFIIQFNALNAGTSSSSSNPG